MSNGVAMAITPLSNQLSTPFAAANSSSLGSTVNGANLNISQTIASILQSQEKFAPVLDQYASGYHVAISALGQTLNDLNQFETKAFALTGNAFNVVTANSSTPGVASATTSNASPIGSYSVQVNQLAQSQTLVSASQTSDTASIGSGVSSTVQFDFGWTANGNFNVDATNPSQTITINSSNNSLEGIASAINNAQIGISAKVNFDGTNYKLALTSPTGAAGSLRISTTGDAAIQGLLAYDPAGRQNLTQTSAAQDAALTINGAAVSSNSNTITTGIAGTTLNLQGTGSSTITITPDANQITSNVQAFLDAYNTVQSDFTTLSNQTRGGGEFNANAAIQDQLAQTAASAPAALNGQTYQNLADVGITRQANGNLALDTTAFQTALNANPDNVAELFTNIGQGIADQFVTQIQTLTGVGGAIPTEISALSNASYHVDRQQSSLQNYLSNQNLSLVSQYKNFSTIG